MNVRSGRAALITILCAGVLAGCAAGPPSTPPELWLYYGVDLGDAGRFAELEQVWTRAARAGYTRVVLADPELARLPRDSSLLAPIARVRSLADSLGLDVIPIVFQVGRSDVMLEDAPDLVEALPVRDQPFVVKNGVVVPEPEAGLQMPDRPQHLDAGVEWTGGGARIRDPEGRARGRFDVRVTPHRLYRVALRVKTQDFGGRLAVHVLDGDHDRSMSRGLKTERTQDWTEVSVPFNSLESSRVQVWFGAWERGPGTAELREFRIDPVGPLNVVRRASTPFELRHADTGAALVEGRDYDAVRDSLLGRSPRPGAFDAWHQPPSIRTRLADGTRLVGSWHHAAVVYGKQVTCCVSEPDVMDRLAREAAAVRRAFGGGRAFMMFDEIRALNRDPACLAQNRDAGGVLAAAAKRCSSLLPDDTLYVWNDMFDPFHNAIANYALVRGDLAGAWEGLDRRVRVVTWNGAHRDASLRFFERRGHRLAIAGYYDGPVESVHDWLQSARDIRGLEAVMYTTWLGKYEDLEAFAKAVRR